MKETSVAIAPPNQWDGARLHEELLAEGEVSYLRGTNELQLGDCKGQQW